LATPSPNVTLTKHPDFRVIHVNGAWILLKPDEGFMKFYLDVVEPKITEAGKTRQLQIEKINK
jgi:hypothetical protein